MVVGRLWTGMDAEEDAVSGMEWSGWKEEYKYIIAMMASPAGRRLDATSLPLGLNEHTDRSLDERLIITTHTYTSRQQRCFDLVPLEKTLS